MSFSCCTVKPLLKLVSILLIVGLSSLVPSEILAQSVLVAGGQVSASLYTDTAEVYNPATSSWSLTANKITYDPLADADGLCAPNMALLGNGQVIIAGGGCTDSGGTTQDASLYDPNANQWTAAPTLNYGRDQFGMVTLNGGNAFAFFGCSGGCLGQDSQGYGFYTVGTSSELYSLAANQWTLEAEFVNPASDNWGTGSLATSNLNQSVALLQGGQV